MSTPLGKRKLPRRELPWIGTLLEKLSYNKLPTKHVVLRRLMFELERSHGASSTDIAALTVRDELKSRLHWSTIQNPTCSTLTLGSYMIQIGLSPQRPEYEELKKLKQAWASSLPPTMQLSGHSGSWPVTTPGSRTTRTHSKTWCR